MLGLSKFLLRNIHKTNECSSVITSTRNVFAPSFFLIDKFKHQCEVVQNDKPRQKDILRQNIEEALENNTKIFTEDLKNFLYITTNESEFDLLQRAVKKYCKQDEMSVYTFSFGPPLMKAAYVLRMTDQMMEMFFDEENAFLHESLKVGTMLMNILYEDKRYDDVIKVYYRMMEKKDSVKRVQTSAIEHKGTYFPFTAIHIASDALLEKDDASALTEMKAIITKLNEENIKYPPNINFTHMLIALKHKDYEYAYELSQISIPVSNINQRQVKPRDLNLKIIILSRLNKIDEALALIKVLLKDDYRRFRERFFQETLDTVKEMIEESNNLVYKEELENILSSTLFSKTMIFNKDIKSYHNMPLTTAPNDLKKEREAKKIEFDRASIFKKFSSDRNPRSNY